MASEVAAEGKTPPMVRLCKGEAIGLVEDRLRMILSSIAASDDPELEVGGATSNLLATSLELVVRFRQYSDYPAALCLMSRRWFPHGVPFNQHSFLAQNPEQLDVGAGLQLHGLAWSRGSEAAAVAWLLSRPVQDLLEKLAACLLANSLPAERRHAQVKT